MEKIGNWFIDEAQDAMNDQLHRVASVQETATDGNSAKEGGVLVISSKIFSHAIMPFLYFSFPKKIFSKREEDVKFKARIDKNPPIEMIFNPSDTGKDAHVDDPGSIYVPLIEANSLLVDLPTMSTGMRRMQFDVTGFSDVLEWFLQDMLAFPVVGLKQFNPSIVDGLLRRGEKNMGCIIDALNGKFFSKKIEPFFGRKTLAHFQAVQAYAEKNRASEIYGIFEQPGAKPNNSWHYSLSQSAPHHVKERWGPLYISQ